MRNIISCMILLIGLLLMQATGAKASTSMTADQQTVKVENRQTATATVTQEMDFVQSDQEKEAPGGFIARNWGILTISLLGFFDVIARLTPTEKDNTILNFLSNILNVIIPNLKKGGGRL
jgi:hypothetical protein